MAPRTVATEEARGGNPEEPDFYMQDGLVVFTASYLRKRGHCCESGCRHCPYDFTPAATDVSLQEQGPS